MGEKTAGQTETGQKMRLEHYVLILGLIAALSAMGYQHKFIAKKVKRQIILLWIMVVSLTASLVGMIVLVMLNGGHEIW